VFGYGGEGGIRTLEGLAPLPVFKTGAINRSATSPNFRLVTRPTRLRVENRHAGFIRAVLALTPPGPALPGGYRSLPATSIKTGAINRSATSPKLYGMPKPGLLWFVPHPNLRGLTPHS
jgi:hypothetical protein